MSTIRDELTLLHSRGGKAIGNERLNLPPDFPSSEKRDYLIPRALIIRLPTRQD
jgi:hypothetical protein